MADSIDEVTREWTKSEADEAAVANGCWFDLAAAQRVEKFFKTFLRHSKGEFAGKPFEILPWQRDDVIYPLFGWKRKDGRRRYQIAYVEIPKKNGKSTMAAGIGLYLLVGDGEPGAEVYSAASTKQQSKIVHNEAVTMTKASEALSEYLKVHGTTNEIRFQRTNSYWRALASEAHSSEGLNIHGLIADEIHAWKGEAGRKFYRALKYGGKARKNPLQFIITTAGDDLLGICWELHQYAKGVLSGEITDDRFFAYIREADPTDDISDPATWYKANPSLGETMSVEDFAADVREAEKSPGAMADFLRYGLNIWNQGGAGAVSPEAWKRCQEDFDESELDGKECFVAIDLARTRDLTSASFLFPQDSGTYRVISRCWLPAKTLGLSTTPEQFRQWAKSGLIKATDGDVTDYDVVRDDIAKLFERFNVQEFTYDPWMAEEFSQKLEDDTGADRFAFPQSIVNYAAPCAEFERLVIAGKIKHNGNPLLAWQVGNLRWRIDPAGNRRPHKTHERNKIDSVVATIMALGRAMLTQETGNVGFSAM